MTTPEENGAGKIVYSVKDLLSEISKKIDVIDGKLENKADRTALDSLANRVQAIETYGSPSLQKEMVDLGTLKQVVQVVQGKIETTEAIRKEQESIGKIYLNRFEVLERKAENNEKRVEILEGVKASQFSSKMLWVPIIFNTLGVILLGIFTIWKG